jgi:hypothetical protein
MKRRKWKRPRAEVRVWCSSCKSLENFTSSQFALTLASLSRGKKFFRRFEADDAEEEDDDNMSDIDIRRRAGTHLRRFTRSNTDYKPVCLWPTEEQRRAREVTAADEADEEMSDYPVTESKANNKIVTHAHAGTPPLPGPEDTTMITTPVNERIQMGFPATPPPTHRQTRSSFKMDMDVTPTVDDPGSSEQFNTWARVKDPDEINLSYHRAGREGSPMRASACVRRTKPAGPLERAQLAKAMRASMADQLEAQAMVETHPTVEVQATVEVHASGRLRLLRKARLLRLFNILQRFRPSPLPSTLQMPSPTRLSIVRRKMTISGISKASSSAIGAQSAVVRCSRMLVPANAHDATCKNAEPRASSEETFCF